MTISHLFPNTVDLIERVPAGWGETTEKITSNVPCRIEYENRLIRDSHGEQVVSHALIFFSHSQEIKQTMKVRISGDGYDHPIIIIVSSQDMSGIHHKEVDIS